MNIHVKRLHYTEKSTISELSIDGVFQCHVLEDKTRAPWEEKVYGKTAISAGPYGLIVNMSTRFKQQMPLLLKVPDFDGVRIHWGNDETASLGCLIVGQYDPKHPDWVSNSKVEYNELFPKLWQAQVHGVKMTITIEDTKVFPTKPAPVKAKK